MDAMVDSLSSPRARRLSNNTDDAPERPQWFVPTVVVGALALIAVLWWAVGSSDTDEAPRGNTAAAAGSNDPPDAYQLASDPDPNKPTVDENGQFVTQTAAEEDVSAEVESDREAAAALFAEGEARCRLEQYESCIATMEAVITLDPTHDAAYDLILQAKASIEARDNPQPETPIGPVEPKLIVVGPDTPRPSDAPDEEQGVDEPRPPTPHNDSEAIGTPTYVTDENGNKVLVLQPDDGTEPSLAPSEQPSPEPAVDRPDGPSPSPSEGTPKP